MFPNFYSFPFPNQTETTTKMKFWSLSGAYLHTLQWGHSNPLKFENIRVILIVSEMDTTNDLLKMST